MARAITIRDVPDAVANELSSRAALTGRSLQEYLLAQLTEMTTKLDAEAWVARVQARVEATGTSLTTEQILDVRSADRR